MNMKQLAGAGLIVAMAAAGEASIPDSDNFDDAAFPNGATFVPFRETWGASTQAVVVTAAQAQSPARSVAVTSGTLTNNVNVTAPDVVVWTDFYLIPQLGDAPKSASTNEASHTHFFDTNGFLNVYTTGGWVPLTHDIHGNSLASAISTTAFNRITIYENFHTATSAVLINGAVVLQDAAFAGSSLDYKTFEVRNSDPTAVYLDTYRVGLARPAGLTVDGNGNNTPDAQELDTQGYVGLVYVVGDGPGADYASLAEVAAIVRSGDRIAISGVVSDTGTATFTDNVTITGDDFTTTAALVVSAGYTLTVDGLAMTVDNTATLNGTLAVANAGAFSAGNMAMAAGGLVSASNGTWAVSSPALQMQGTFTISGATYNNLNAAVALNMADDFEQYALNVPLGSLSFRGWGASQAGAVVTNLAGQQGGRSAAVVGVVSNRINGGTATKVWTDFQIRALLGDAPTTPDTATASALIYFTTNGYLAVYDDGLGQFVELSTDAGGGLVPAITAGSWARVSVFNRYDSDDAAVFLNGQLLGEQIAFPVGDAPRYSLFAVENKETYAVALDSVAITQLTPTLPAGDVDGDTRQDVQEIQDYGTITAVGYPVSIIRFK